MLIDNKAPFSDKITLMSHDFFVIIARDEQNDVYVKLVNRKDGSYQIIKLGEIGCTFITPGA